MACVRRSVVVDAEEEGLGRGVTRRGTTATMATQRCRPSSSSLGGSWEEVGEGGGERRWRQLGKERRGRARVGGVVVGMLYGGRKGGEALVVVRVTRTMCLLSTEEDENRVA